MKVTERTLLDFVRCANASTMAGVPFGLRVVGGGAVGYKVRRLWRDTRVPMDDLSEFLPARECLRWMQGFLAAVSATMVEVKS